MSQKFDLSEVLAIPDLPAYLKRVETCMQAALGVEQSELSAAVLRLTKARGKRLRPALVIATALLADKKVSTSAIKAAAAVELIHLGSLVHDDIIDEAPTRWNLPTINAQEGLNYAILGGDLLLATACALAGEVSQEAGLVAAQTIVQLCGGQSAELAVQYNPGRTEAQAQQAIHGKTAALLAAACRLGGICTNQPAERLEALMSFGHDFGLAFQLIDDVLDFVSSDTLLGKPIGNDVKEGVYTLPVILALKGPNRSTVAKALAGKTAAPAALTELLLEDSSIAQTLAKAQAYNHAAEQTLVAAFGNGAHNLALLPKNYLDWALSNLVASEYKRQLARFTRSKS